MVEMSLSLAFHLTNREDCQGQQRHSQSIQLVAQGSLDRDQATFPGTFLILNSMNVSLFQAPIHAGQNLQTHTNLSPCPTEATSGAKPMILNQG